MCHIQFWVNCRVEPWLIGITTGWIAAEMERLQKWEEESRTGPLQGLEHLEMITATEIYLPEEIGAVVHGIVGVPLLVPIAITQVAGTVRGEDQELLHIAAETERRQESFQVGDRDQGLR